MKISDRFLFVAETLDDKTFYLIANCLSEALYKAEEYVEEHYKEDLVESVCIVHGEVIEDEESDRAGTEVTETKREKLALVIGKIDGKNPDGSAA